ncbi:hypothetical protein GCM10009425_47590 [Pseudomonas asuensis]|uniref:TrfB transcriptional repressor protein domain-containing protein n=2 Tax=Pseudomonas asuensis TaxID=1825787 RepID=A0ABQ2H4I5_9PSED|nr:hypothetical protein GCM10009425_47590 [Pseudomonas asuensis]
MELVWSTRGQQMRKREPLSPEEFDLLRPHFGARWKPANIEAMRQILVEGCKQKDIAAELDVTEKAVSQMVKKTYEMHVKYGAKPSGWVTVFVTLPPELAEHVKQMEHTARENLANKGR